MADEEVTSIKTFHHKFVNLNDICKQLNIKITHVFHCTLNSRWRLYNLRDNFNRLYFVLDGHGYIYNDKERVDLEPYNIYIVPANTCYNYRCDEYMEKLYIHFNLSVIPNKDLLRELGRVITIPSTKAEIENIRDIFYKDDLQTAIFCQDLVRRIAFGQADEFKDIAYDDMKLYNKYRDLYKYVESNISAKLSVEEVCKNMGFSQTYIGHQFKSDTGQTIKEYISALLIDRIKWMLLNGQPLYIIAEELKFSDPSYCSKFFTKHVGISPKDFVRKHVN